MIVPKIRKPRVKTLKPRPPRQNAPRPQPRVADPLAPMSDAAIKNEAARQVENYVAPERQAINDAIAAAKREGEASAKTMAGYGAANAELLKGIAPAVSQFYDTAAARVQDAAKGLSDGFVPGQQAAADEAAHLLELSGAPASQGAAVLGPGGVGGPGMKDLLYGTAALPVSQLAREGAARASADAMLPATTLGVTQQQEFELQGKVREQIAQHQAELTQLAAKIPSIRDQVMQGIMGSETDKAKAKNDFRIAKAKALQQAQHDANSLALSEARLQMEHDRISLSNARLTMDQQVANARFVRSDRAYRLQKSKWDWQKAHPGVGKKTSQVDKRKAQAEAVKSQRAWLDTQVKVGTGKAGRTGGLIKMGEYATRSGRVPIYDAVGPNGQHRSFPIKPPGIKDVTNTYKPAGWSWARNSTAGTSAHKPPSYQKLYPQLNARLTLDLTPYGYSRGQINNIAQSILAGYGLKPRRIVQPSYIGAKENYNHNRIR